MVAVVFLAALWIRVAPSYREVFRDGEVWFQGNDAWYHARLIEHWRQNFPRRLLHDPYLRFVEATGVQRERVPVAPLWDLMVALPAVVLGLGAHATRVWTAIAPALLGAAGCVLLYGCARTLFGGRAGVLGAALLAIEPGGYLARSTLGFCDHHALEATLSLGVVWALVHVAKRAELESRRTGASGFRGGLLPGLLLGAYLLAWSGAALLVAVICAWVAIQGARELVAGPAHTGRPIWSWVWTVPAVAALLLACGAGTTPRWPSQAMALGGTLATLLALALVARLLGPAAPRAQGLARRSGGERRRPLAGGALALVALGLVALVAARVLPREWIGSLRIDLLRMLPRPGHVTVAEVIPLLRLDGPAGWLPAWLTFRTAFFLGLGGTVALGWRWLRSGRAHELLPVLWTLAMLGATIGQNRFGYYLSVALALLAGWVLDGVLEMGRIAAGPTSSKARAGSRTLTHLFRALAPMVVALLVLPSAVAGIEIARATHVPNPGWRSALAWLRESSPEPYGSPDAFLAFPDELEARGAGAGSYGVLSWWDYGYWITGLGHRIPLANPTQSGAGDAADILLEPDTATAIARLKQENLRYVIVDPRFAAQRVPNGVQLGLVPAMLDWRSEARSTPLLETVLVSAGGGRWQTQVLFHPDYYRILTVRLAAFGVDAVEPASPTLVVRLGNLRQLDGSLRRAVVSTRAFARYQDAQEAVDADPNLVIASFDPTSSSVPLPPIGLEEIGLHGGWQGVRIFRLATPTTPSEPEEEPVP